GYMTESAHAYYQGANPGYLYTAAFSSNTRVRALYDNTYEFVKGTYTLAAPVLSAKKLTVTDYDNKTYGFISFTDSDSKSSEVKFSVVTEAQHGTVALAATGDYSYLPNEGYNGKDTFTVKAFDGFMYSDELTVTLLVGDVSADDESTAESKTGIDVSDVGDSTGSAWLYGAIGAAAALITAAAVIVCKKKKKN
ncbi:MAG TPA: Ig-like domain-containing protein, partial [Bacillota bacterium]|nr:Ig-like domain-containing protein [Bacillota bacterium]